ncbi:MAG: helix-turn-helix transcriptional regulator [Rhizomicrobium sp.]
MMTNRIKQLRYACDMTQGELAERCGVRRETIVFLEQGKYNPSLALAHAVAKTLAVTIDELFQFDD